MQVGRVGPIVWAGLISELIMNAVAFMAIPLFAVYLDRELNFSAIQIGTIFTIYLLSARIPPLVLGAAADRVGYLPLMVASTFVRTVGLFGFIILTQFGDLALMALLIGLGTALHEPSVSGLFAGQPEADRPRIFSLRNLFLNIGVIGGPGLGAFLTLYGLKITFLASAIVSGTLGVALFTLSRLFHPQHPTSSFIHHYRKTLGHRRFLIFSAIMVMWWIAYQQLFVSLPLQAAVIGNGNQWANVVFLVNGVVGMLAILFILRLFESRKPLHVLPFGFLLAGVGFGLIPVLPSIWWLLACVAVYTIGETVVLPGSDIVISTFGDKETRATFFGLFATTWALGGSIGNYVGSALITQNDNSFTPWLLYGSLFVGCAVATLLYNRSNAKQQSTSPTT